MTLSNAVMLAVLAGILGFALGFGFGLPSKEVASEAVIEAAQRASLYGANPKWLQLAPNRSQIMGVRNRGYAFCLSGQQISQGCASEQDVAVHDVALFSELAKAQREMTDKSKLTDKERYIADNPHVIAEASRFCWNLYKRHGAMDARILAVCLGNLNASSLVAPLPVVD